MSRETLFMTGATGLLGGAVLRRMLQDRPDLRAYVLVRDGGRWARAAAERGIDSRRVVALQGDLREPGLGLEPTARRRLALEVGTIVHLAADITFSRPLARARETNVEGTRGLLDLSASWRARFCYVSTAFVAGRRTGAILENDPGGQLGWVNAYEQSKWEAEQLVRNSGQDFLILRSSTVVCDSPAGTVSQYNAVHRAMRLFHGGLAAMIPGREQAPVDLVTADYVSAAVATLAARPHLSGETLHLCAGSGAATLGELLDSAYTTWAADPAWRRRAIARPLLADLPTYRLFEEAVAETADPRLRQIVQSLSYFAPQLALEKRFDTSGADAALGFRPPPLGAFWPGVLHDLMTNHWGRLPITAAA